MAELHRRVLRFPGSKRLGILNVLTCIWLVSASLVFSSSALADAPTVADIERWAGDLRSGDDRLIAEATRNLGQLGQDALPAIEARLQRTSRQIIPEEDGADALRYFRHAVGSRRADDTIDIAPGIPEVVKERPSPDVGRAAERLLLLRSLERIGTVPAQRLMGDVFALTPSMWGRERRTLLERMGSRLLPGLLWMRAHDEPDVRRWARAAISRLGLDQPGRAVQEEDPERLAGILEAYGATREMDAMTVIISFVGHNDERVRQAARDAMNLFARNGIWQLREGMRNQLGEEADHEWGWERTATLLYEGLDAQRLGPVTERLERGLAHVAAGELAEARALFDAALIREPMHPRRGELAEHYARFAEDASGSERETLLQRALWLNPESAQSAQWRRALRDADMQQNLAAGFVDVQAEEADEADPQVAAADAPAVEHAEGESLAGVGALFLGVVLLLAGLLWKRAWFAERARSLRIPRGSLVPRPKPSTRRPSPHASRAAVRKRLSAWKDRLIPLASRLLKLTWKATCWLGREALSLGRTIIRVVSPGSVKQTNAKNSGRRPKAKATPKAKAAQTPAPKPKAAALNNEATSENTLPLAGLLFPLGSSTKDEEAHDTVDTALRDMPSELPAHLFSDTSPGTIEAPDTLPG